MLKYRTTKRTYVVRIFSSNNKMHEKTKDCAHLFTSILFIICRSISLFIQSHYQYGTNCQYKQSVLIIFAMYGVNANLGKYRLVLQLAGNWGMGMPPKLFPGKCPRNQISVFIQGNSPILLHYLCYLNLFTVRYCTVHLNENKQKS